MIDRQQELEAARQRYADIMDNLAKYARAECDAVRAGQPWDESDLTRALLNDANRALSDLNIKALRAHTAALARTTTSREAPR